MILVIGVKDDDWRTLHYSLWFSYVSVWVHFWMDKKRTIIIMKNDTISRAAALKGLEELNIASFYEENEHSKEVYAEVKAMLETLSPAESELENKIRAIGYTGKEGRIYIGGRLFAVRELPQ